MPLESYLAFGVLTDADGIDHAFVRRFGYRTAPPKAADDSTQRPRSIGPKMALLHADDAAGGLAFDARSRGTARGEDIAANVSGHEAVFRSQSTDPHFECRWEPGSIVYEETDLVAVSGRFLKPGIQWALLGRDRSIYYASHMYEVSGRIAGKDAHGFMCLDQAFMPDGAVLYAKDDVITGEELELCWYIWGTVSTTEASSSVISISDTTAAVSRSSATAAHSRSKAAPRTPAWRAAPIALTSIGSISKWMARPGRFSPNLWVGCQGSRGAESTTTCVRSAGG
jgi:hypothetical protein